MDNAHENDENQNETHSETLDETYPTLGSEARSSPGQTPESRLAVKSVIAHRFRIDAYLAAGGMGLVYRAHDLDLDVPLALKTIRPEIAANPAALRGFKQEVLT